MIRVSITDDAGSWQSWWENFAKFADQEWFTNKTRLEQSLAKFNAFDVPDTEFIAFRNEKDMVLFILRWS